MGLSAVEPVRVSSADLRPASTSAWDAALSRPIVLLLLLAAIPYLSTLRNGFIYDDIQQIFQNPYVHSFRYIGAVFGSKFWSFLGAEGGLNYYRPLATITYMVCYALSGSFAFDYHLVNIALNAANVAMLYWVTRRLWSDSAIALAAAAIFALHPVHTEAVAWISSAADLEVTFFYLLAFGLYLSARRPGASLLLRLAVLASFALALLSKEIAITLPAAATIYELFYASDPSGAAAAQPDPVRAPVRESMSGRVRKTLWRCGSLWAMAMIYMSARVFLAGGLPTSLVRHSMNLSETIFSGVAAAGLYLGKLVWPAHLHLIYLFHKSTSPMELPVLAGFAGLAICTLLFLVLWKRARLASFGLIWLALTVAPVLNLRWMPRPFAERYLYLPSVGFCWLLAYGLVWLWRRNRVRDSAAARAAFAGTLAIALVLCLARIETRDREWHDSLVFTLHEVAASPSDPGLRVNLGSIYWQHGDTTATEREWNTALRVDPQDEEAMTQIGLLRNQQQRYAEALTLLQTAIRIRPTFFTAHLGLAQAYVGAGRREDAEREYRAAMNLAPENVVARNRLAQLLYDEGRRSEAEEQFRASAQIQPTQLACDRLGELAFARGDAENAIHDYVQAIAIEPFDALAHFRLGDLYAAAGRASDAAREYQDGLATNPNDAHAQAALRTLQNVRP